MANNGAHQALLDENLLNGMNVHDGNINDKPVADVLGYEYVPSTKALA